MVLYFYCSRSSLSLRAPWAEHDVIQARRRATSAARPPLCACSGLCVAVALSLLCAVMNNVVLIASGVTLARTISEVTDHRYWLYLEVVVIR